MESPPPSSNENWPPFSSVLVSTASHLQPSWESSTDLKKNGPQTGSTDGLSRPSATLSARPVLLHRLK